MKAKSSHRSTRRQSTPLAYLAVCLGSFALAGEEPPAVTQESEEVTEEYFNHVEVTVGGFDIKGNDAAFQRRWGNNGDFYGGIESFRIEESTDAGTFLLEGHALFGLEDYDITLGYVKDDVGYVRAGYREFRTWYDLSGGYIPGVPDGWRSPNSGDDLELDRGDLWFEAGLRMPDLPDITLRYSHQWRDGEKDSTVWGDVYPGGLRRGISPGLNRIDETRDTVALDIAHTLGNTDLALGLRYEGVRNDNTRSTVTAGNAAETFFNRLDQRDVYEYDLFGGHVTSITRFNERMMLSFGYALTTMDTEVDGSQRGSVNLNTGVFNPTYALLNGSGDYVQNTMNLNFWWNPIDDLVIVPAVRFNWEDTEMDARQFATLADVATGVPTVVRGFDEDLREFSQSLEIRYTGLEDMVLYASGDWMQGTSDRMLVPTATSFRATDTDIDEARYRIGANWYPVRGLSFSTQYNRITYDEDYDNRFSPGGIGKFNDPQFAAHRTETDNFNIRMTWRALPNLSLVTRYDYQQTDIGNQAFTDNNNPPAVSPSVRSADIESHTLSQSATWNVSERLYLQGSMHWISAETQTPASGFQGDSHVNWDNDYWSATLSAGYVINRNTDVRASYYYFRADNYLDNSAETVPYGIDATEHALTVTLTQWLTPQMAWNLRYGYFRGDDDAVGGFNDYEAHMLSAGFRYQF